MKTGKYNRKKIYDTLCRLCCEEVPASEVKSSFYDDFKKNEIIQCFKSKKGRGYVYTSSYTFDILKEKVKILLDIDLELFKNLSNYSTREEITAAKGSSKDESSVVDNDICINVFPNSITYMYDGQKCVLPPLVGISYHVSDWRKFQIPSDVIIVITENDSPIYNVNTYDKEWKNGRSYFFILRKGKLNKVYDWLNTKQPDNKIFHFGDYDMGAITIYKSIKKKLLNKKRYHFYMPPKEELEKILKKSKSDLFFKQYKNSNIDTDEEDIKNLVQLINRYGKTIEQEILPSYGTKF